MKYTLSISDCTKEEVKGILAKLEGGTQVELSSAAPVAEVEATNEDASDLNKLTKADLQALCDQRALRYAGRSTKKDLIDLLEGRAQPVQDAPPVETLAPTLQPEVVVPQAQATPLVETPATVEVAPAVDKQACIANFTDCYNHMLGQGHQEANLQAELGQILTNLGHAGQRLSLLPDNVLDQAVGSFRQRCAQLVAQTAQAPTQPNAFI